MCFPSWAPILCLEGIVSITLTLLGRPTTGTHTLWCGLPSDPNTVAIEGFLEPHHTGSWCLLERPTPK